jgi:hypothetical protein
MAANLGKAHHGWDTGGSSCNIACQAPQGAGTRLRFPQGRVPIGYWLDVILRIVFVVLAPVSVGTISTRPPQVATSSAPTMVDAV